MSFFSSVRHALILAALTCAVALFAACGGDDDEPGGDNGGGGHQTVQVTLVDAGCSPNDITVEAGTVTFEVTNDGAGSITEFYVYDGDRVVGEVENIIDGLSGDLTLDLEAGEYTTKCPGGKEDEEGTLTVTEASSPATAEVDPDLEAAVVTYKAYVAEQTGLLVTASEDLRDAIATGDVEASKEAYIAARPYYERIEPIAESFGDLDPLIDARADDVPAEELTGFHRIEYTLWEENTTEGLDPIADQLVTDVTRLRDDSPDIELDAIQVVNGAIELLGEVSASKITGEEERYSHIDLLDFEANVEGAEAAYNSVRDALVKRDADLADTVDARFEAVFAALLPYKVDGEYVLYTELDDNDTLELGQVIDALGEPLSEVPVTLTEPVA